MTLVGKKKPKKPGAEKGAVGGEKEECAKVEYEIVELVEVVTQDKEKWVKGAAMDTTAITDKVERTDKDGANFKQYINLKRDLEGKAKRHPEYGRKIIFKARIKQKDGKTDKLAGAKVEFSRTRIDGPNRTNTGPPDPKVWKKNKGVIVSSQKDGFGSSNGKSSATVSTDAKGWTSSVSFFLSKFAGDQFLISAALHPKTNGAKGATPVKAKANYVVWRKFWYQMTHADGYNPSTPTKAEDAYKEVFAEMVKSKTKKFTKADLPADLKDRTFLKEYMLKKGGADSVVAAIGGHNKSKFTKKPIFDKTLPKNQALRANLIICEYQCDPKGRSKLGKHKLESNGQEITLSKGSGGGIVSKPALKANSKLVVVGQWSKKRSPWVRKGYIKDSCIEIIHGRASTLTVKVDLSKGASGSPPVPTVAKPLYIKLKVETAQSYLGESFGKGQILCVYRPAATAGTQGSDQDYNDTVAHELGHMWRQTPRPNKQPGSMRAHPLQYVGHGGQGSHCRQGSKASLRKKGNNLIIASQDASTTITEKRTNKRTHKVASTAGFIKGHKVYVKNVRRRVKLVVDATHLKFTTAFTADVGELVKQKLSYNPVNWNSSGQKYPQPYNGGCLMFHCFTTACTHKFCKTCKPYLQLQSMTSI